MTRWTRTINAGALLEIEVVQTQPDPPQALVLEVEKGRLTWDEQGEDARSIRIWADRHPSAVLRLTGRFARARLSASRLYLDHDMLDGEVVREGWIEVSEHDAGVLLRCEQLEARITVHARDDHRARASSE